MVESETAYQALLEDEVGSVNGQVPTELEPVEGQYRGSHHYSLSPEAMTLAEKYEHAAIYLEEGERHLYFKYHPTTRETVRAYKIVNGRLLNLFDLMAANVLLALALFENPAVYEFPLTASALIEIAMLLCLLIHSFFYYRWKGLNGLKEKKLIFKHVLLIEMLIESSIVLSRQCHHLRFMRAFRPIFLITNRYASGIKRVLRELMQSLPPVLDVLILLLMFVTTFAVLGFYLFTEESTLDEFTDDLKNWYFEDLAGSWINLFILTTTANYPDVMMPAYKKRWWAPIYFIFFLLLGLYFIGNLLLAAVYSNFNKKESEKFARLYCHQRRGLRLAFEIVDQDGTNKMDFDTFKGILSVYDSWKTMDVLIAIFYALDKDGKGYLTLDDWFQLPTVLTCSWRQGTGHAAGLFCGTDKYPLKTKPVLERLRKVVESKWFEYFIGFAIVVNAGFIIAEATIRTMKHINSHLLDGYEEAFLALYTLEALLKITSLGFRRYIKSGFNKFDFFIVAVGLIGEAVELEVAMFITMLRPFRLLRLLRLRQSFLNILASMFNLVPKMIRFVLTLLCVYFFFAIIGMESFSGLLSKCGCVLRNDSGTVQCQSELFHDQKAYTFVMSDCGRYYGGYYDRSAADGLYYLNNFDNLLRSYVTLFELMVVNNWHVTMQGTVDAVHYFRPSAPEELSRAYYILFFLVTVIIVTNVVVAFILDAFQSLLPLMKERYQLIKVDEDPLVMEIHIDKEDFDLLMEGRKPRKFKVKDPDHVGVYRLLGRRPISNLDIHATLFTDGIKARNDEEAMKAGKRERDAQNWAHTPGIITGTPPPSEEMSGNVHRSKYESPSKHETTETCSLGLA